MKKEKLSKYFKLATVLLIDAIPVFFTIRMTTTDIESSGFNWLVIMMMFLFFFVFNIWALIIYYLTKLIKRLWLRDILFYFLSFLFLFVPILYLLLKQLLK